MVIWDSRTHGPLDLRSYLGQDWFSTAGRPQRRFRPVYVSGPHMPSKGDVRNLELVDSAPHISQSRCPFK